MQRPAETVAESVGLEIARLYAQLEAVYNAGFINTAMVGSGALTRAPGRAGSTWGVNRCRGRSTCFVMPYRTARET